MFELWKTSPEKHEILINIYRNEILYPTRVFERTGTSNREREDQEDGQRRGQTAAGRNAETVANIRELSCQYLVLVIVMMIIIINYRLNGSKYQMESHKGLFWDSFYFAHI